jgi:eukaryotic-like serine/threonine-protein kinase
MNQRERNDAIFRTALTPRASRTVTSGLADSIHDALVDTTQVKGSVRWSLPWRGIRPLMRVSVVALVIVGLLLLVALIAVLSARPRPGPLGVPMYRGGPERTGLMPGPGPATSPTILWQIDATGPVAVMPAVVDGTVYVADEGGAVWALEAATGHKRWSVDLGDAVDGSPAVADGRLYVGTKAGQVVALDVVTGSVVWRFSTGGPVRASSVIVDGVLYVGSDDGNVYAIDAVTGRQRWMTSLGAPVTRGPAVSDGVVYATASGGHVRALDVTTGAVRWTKDDLGPGEMGTPIVSDGLLFVAGGLLEQGPSCRVTALDIRDGGERWHFGVPDGTPVYAGAVAAGAFYVASDDGDVYRLDAGTGTVAPGWPFHGGGANGYLSGIAGGTLYIPSADRKIYAVDAGTGLERWNVGVQGGPYGPAVIDGRIFVGTNLGKIIAIGGSGPSATDSP